MATRRRDTGKGPTRRHFVCVGLGALAAVAGCSGKPPAPRAARLGRESCQHCGMLISDPRYVTQIWDPEYGRVRVYDDFGCAVLAAERREELDRDNIGFWVADENEPGRWLEARSARYRSDVATPMGYGYAAGTGERYSRDFATAVAAVRSRSLCVPAD